tara:strand:- start:35 stop:160 length:126 start_codon:yes stop_codon:yes gene_type:complete
MKALKTLLTATILLVILSSCASKNKCHIWRGFYCHPGRALN